MTTTKPVSKSRNVNGYLRAWERWHALEMKLTVQELRLLPLKRKCESARVAMKVKRNKLTGGQIGEAERLIAPLQAGRILALAERETQRVEK